MKRKLSKRKELKELIIKDADKLTEMIYKVIKLYGLKDLKKAWKRLLKHQLFYSSIFDVLAILPKKRN